MKVFTIKFNNCQNSNTGYPTIKSPLPYDDMLK